MNNTVTGRNISLVISQDEFKRALNVIHGEIFGVAKKINIAILVTERLWNFNFPNFRIRKNIEKRKGIKLNVFAIANSKKVLLNKFGISENWKATLEDKGQDYKVEDIIAYAKEHHLENLIAIDNTASATLIENYISLAENSLI